MQTAHFVDSDKKKITTYPLCPVKSALLLIFTIRLREEGGKDDVEKKILRFDCKSVLFIFCLENYSPVSSLLLESTNPPLSPGENDQNADSSCLAGCVYYSSRGNFQNPVLHFAASPRLRADGRKSPDMIRRDKILFPSRLVVTTVPPLQLPRSSASSLSSAAPILRRHYLRKRRASPGEAKKNIYIAVSLAHFQLPFPQFVVLVDFNFFFLHWWVDKKGPTARSHRGSLLLLLPLCVLAVAFCLRLNTIWSS